MAEPTLTDVLAAIATIDQKVDDVRGEMATKRDLAEVRREQATIGALAELRRELVAAVDAHRAETDAHRAETKKGFDDLDKELTGHADAHRKLEKDIEALKRRALRTAARAPRRSRTR